MLISNEGLPSIPSRSGGNFLDAIRSTFFELHQVVQLLIERSFVSYRSFLVRQLRWFVIQLTLRRWNVRECKVSSTSLLEYKVHEFLSPMKFEQTSVTRFSILSFFDRTRSPSSSPFPPISSNFYRRRRFRSRGTLDYFPESLIFNLSTCGFQSLSNARQRAKDYVTRVIDVGFHHLFV